MQAETLAEDIPTATLTGQYTTVDTQWFQLQELKSNLRATNNTNLHV
jgi:hypothetical protein